MKVNVLQVQDATFRRFRRWSMWVDVAVYDYECTPYLLQMQVNRSNKKRFRSVRITGSIIYRQANSQVIGDLTAMSREAQ